MLKLIKSLSRSQKRMILLLVDMGLVPAALLFTFAVQQNMIAPLAAMSVIAPVFPYILAVSGLLTWYLGIPMIRLKTYELKASGKTALLSLCLAIASGLLAWIVKINLSAGFHIMFGISFFLLSAISRFLMLQILLVLYRRDQPSCRVLIYGAGMTGIQLASALNAHEIIDPVAFVDDNPALQGLTVIGLRVYRPMQIEKMIQEEAISRVLLAMPSLSQPKQNQITRWISGFGVDVQVLPSFAQLIGEEDLVDKLAPIAPGQFLGRNRLDQELEGGCNSYTGRNILISGAGGSIGSELCRQVLACHPKRLVLYDLSEAALYTVDMELRQLAEGNGAEIVPILGSVTDANQVRRVLAEQEVQVVLHAAAYKHVPLVENNPLAGMANNVLGTQILARLSGEYGVERFILISSDKAVRPTNVMGASKRMAEHVVQDLASRSRRTIFTMVRFGNVLGSSGSVVPLFQEQVARGGPVTLTHNDITRYFMTLNEAARLVLLAGSFAEGGEVFVLDMGKPVAIRLLAKQVIEAAGYAVRDAENPEGDIEIVVTGLRRGEKMHEELMIGDGVIHTNHAKIFTVREQVRSEIEIAASLRALQRAIADGDVDAAREVAVLWVEGYRPATEEALGGSKH